MSRCRSTCLCLYNASLTVVIVSVHCRAPEVRLLSEDKEPLGIMPTQEALMLAQDAGVDLIMVVADANPPVCRLVELSKYNYELAKAAKDAKKKQRESTYVENIFIC